MFNGIAFIKTNLLILDTNKIECVWLYVIFKISLGSILLDKISLFIAIVISAKTPSLMSFSLILLTARTAFSPFASLNISSSLFINLLIF